jgi:putative transposase
VIEDVFAILGDKHQVCVEVMSDVAAVTNIGVWFPDLVRQHDFIAHEDLKISNMVKAPTPKPDPETPGTFLPNGAAAKAGLNHSISDAGWGVFLTVLHAKAESAGREVIAVDPRNTSRTCPECGHVSAENRPTQEKFACVSCGHSTHADTVGALNVLRAGLVRRDANRA